MQNQSQNDLVAQNPIKNGVARFTIINHLLKVCKGRRFLEIGVEDGDNINQIDRNVLSHGVDPYSNNATHRVKSDEFFAMLHPKYCYDVIFVDGLHVAEQALRDFENALKHLSPGGFLVAHDCSPPNEYHQRSEKEAAKTSHRNWTGDVYKALIRLRQKRDDIFVCVVDTDYGCAVIQKATEKIPANPLQITAPEDYDQMQYSWFDAKRTQLLNLISTDEFFKIFS